MLRDAAVSLIANRLGRRTDLDADIVSEMQLVQQAKLEGDAAVRPWFLLTETLTLTLAAGAETIALPADFLDEAEGFPLAFEDTTIDPTSADRWVALAKDDYPNMIEKSEDAGVLTSYALVGTTIYVRGVPDTLTTFRLIYVKRAAALDTNIENEWLLHAPDLVIAETGLVMASTYTNDQKRAAAFQSDAARARDRLHRENEARQHVNRTYQMGDD